MAAMLFLRPFFRFPFSTGPCRNALAALAMALLGALALPAHAQNEGAATAGTASPAASASAAPADPKLLEQAERATLANDERIQIQVTARLARNAFEVSCFTLEAEQSGERREPLPERAKVVERALEQVPNA